MTRRGMPRHTNTPRPPVRGAPPALGGGGGGGAAGVAAIRHSQGPCVTASIDRVDFLEPIRLGDIVVVRAQVNFVARTSMEVGVRVDCEDTQGGASRYTAKAYLTFVAVDDRGRPRPVPPLLPETDEERRRFSDAERRRAARLPRTGRPP